MVWLGKDIKDHLISPPCHGQGQYSQDQDAHPTWPSTLSEMEQPQLLQQPLCQALTPSQVKSFLIKCNLNLSLSYHYLTI